VGDATVIQNVSEFPQYALHLQFRQGEVVTIAEVFTLPAALPGFQINIQRAISMARPLAAYADLENLASQRFSEV
jgi:hypothetical protein